MKKLMMAVAVVLAAVSVNAATFSWKTSTTGKLYVAGGAKTVASATAYLFDATVLSQNDVLTAVLSDSKDISTLAYTSSAEVSSGTISTTYFDVPSGYASGDAFTSFVAVVLDDEVFVSDTVSADTPSTGNKGYSFALKTASSNAATTFTGTQSAAGWYSVPEPTSGLLLLVGGALLALRRRRA